jgi:hypothetical protein
MGSGAVSCAKHWFAPRQSGVWLKSDYAELNHLTATEQVRLLPFLKQLSPPQIRGWECTRLRPARPGFGRVDSVLLVKKPDLINS